MTCKFCDQPGPLLASASGRGSYCATAGSYGISVCPSCNERGKGQAIADVYVNPSDAPGGVRRNGVRLRDLPTTLRRGLEDLPDDSLADVWDWYWLPEKSRIV